MDLSGMSVAVIGLGVSGVAAARLAAEKGGEVYAVSYTHLTLPTKA